MKSTTYISHCLNGVYVIHLSRHQLPNGRLNFHVSFRDITCVDKIPPRLRQVIECTECFFWVLGNDVGRLRFWNAIFHVSVEQLAQLILVGVLWQGEGNRWQIAIQILKFLVLPWRQRAEATTVASVASLFSWCHSSPRFLQSTPRKTVGCVMIDNQPKPLF